MGDFPTKVNELASLDAFCTNDEEKFMHIVDNFAELFLCKNISASNNVRVAMASYALLIERVVWMGDCPTSIRVWDSEFKQNA